jgi:exopolyphosphatase/guanosine-5'-triphosphate,3'-diphosphate pyrophosphatase
VLMSQVMCLRLAAILHHARIELPPKVVSLGPMRQRKRLGQTVRHAQLQLSSGWAQEHPRTLHLLQEEVRRWASQGTVSQLELALV